MSNRNRHLLEICGKIYDLDGVDFDGRQSSHIVIYQISEGQGKHTDNHKKIMN